MLIFTMDTNSFSQEKLPYNDLSRQESFVIEPKELKLRSRVNIQIIPKRAHMYVKNAGQPSIIHHSNLNPTADGQALMMRSREQ